MSRASEVKFLRSPKDQRFMVSRCPTSQGLQPCDVQAGQPYSVHHAAAGDVGKSNSLPLCPHSQWSSLA